MHNKKTDNEHLKAEIRLVYIIIQIRTRSDKRLYN